MYAVIQTGGKQYRVAEGDVIQVEKIDGEGQVRLDKVLLISDGDNVSVGAPYLAGAFVDAQIEASGRMEKVIIYKYKAKKDYRKKQGHRQPFTRLLIQKINA